MQDPNVSLPPLRYISEKAVVELTGIPRSTLQKDRHYRRGLPYIKLGKLVRYNVQDILRHMEAHRIDPAEQR
jgi:predicted DNA-binding transcriptional regulator AlpA